MAGSLRLLLQPIGTPGRELELVQGCTLDLAVHGAGTTNASDSAVPAKIEFVGRFTPAVRTHPALDERALGELSGTIELSGPLRQGFFVCDEASLEQLRNPPPIRLPTTTRSPSSLASSSSNFSTRFRAPTDKPRSRACASRPTPATSATSKWWPSSPWAARQKPTSTKTTRSTS